MKKFFCFALLLAFAACGQTEETQVLYTPADHLPDAVLEWENREIEAEPADLSLEDDPDYQDGPRRYSTLWLGTMTMFSNEMPRQFSDIAHANDVSVSISLATDSWASLNVLENMLLERLSGNRRFDYVIMAELPGRYLQYPDEFTEDLIRLSEAIRDVGATPVLFAPPWGFGDEWPYDLFIEHSTFFLANAAEQSGAIFVDVSRAWAEIYFEHPGLNLFVPAGNPSRQGAFLTACVLLAELLDLQVTEMPDWSFYVYDGDFAETLALAAWEFVNAPEED
ncbi:MAG: hypothetical protein FWC70_09545 [Defluviitaleaceae bacterium]|nr:hypothetical protein [Defluviitaleaceae bacterium]